MQGAAQPKATGQHCPEGFTAYPLAGPSYQGSVAAGGGDSPYYTFVDRFDMLGTGSNNVPMATGNQSEALVALVKGYDGRLDNPNAGWKGKAIYSTFATRAPFHTETGKGTMSKVVKFQVRPDPLAR